MAKQDTRVITQTTERPHFSAERTHGVVDTGGCECQYYGKSGVAWPSGKCMICGYKVNPHGRLSQ